MLKTLSLILLLPLSAFPTIVLVENFFSPNPFPPEGWSTHYEGDAVNNE